MWLSLFALTLHVFLCESIAQETSIGNVKEFPDPKIGNERLAMIRLPNVDLSDRDEKKLQNVRKVPTSEMRQRFGALLDMMDINGDSKIEKKELIDWTYALLKKRDHDNGRVAFKEADQDGDNFLTLSEAVMKRFNRKKEDMDALKDSPYDSDTFDYTTYLKHLEDFAYYDLNKDKKLDEREYHLLDHPWEFDYSAEKLVKDKLETYDFDNDGFITLHEFAVEANEYPEGSQSYNEVKDMFAKWDDNKDGKLNSNEMIWGWSFPDRLEEANDIVKKVWTQTDVNRDGYLTKKEALPFYILWCKHDITNTGSVLGVRRPNLIRRPDDPEDEQEEEQNVESSDNNNPRVRQEL